MGTAEEGLTDRTEANHLVPSPARHCSEADKRVDFSLLLPDVMTIADEVDSQLTQAMDSYMNVKRQPAPAAA
jgi:hypothetical protein